MAGTGYSGKESAEHIEGLCSSNGPRTCHAATLAKERGAERLLDIQGGAGTYDARSRTGIKGLVHRRGCEEGGHLAGGKNGRVRPQTDGS